MNQAEIERQRLVHRAKEQRAKIAQYFVDVASWNENSRARREEGADLIDPDPDGTMQRLADSLDRFLVRETERSLRLAKDQAHGR